MRFVKALLSAQFATLVDFITTVLLSSVLGIYYVVGTALGAFAGGVTNCIVNYRWVFPGNGVSKRYVALKFFLVWLMSIMLNTYGTFLLTEWLNGSSWVVDMLGRYANQVYILSKIVVAVLVAFCWNYQMQRLFVFRNLRVRRDSNDE